MVPALRTVGNMIVGSNNACAKLVEMGLLESIKTVINCQKASIVKEVFWCVSNLVASTHEITIEVLKDTDLHQEIIKSVNHVDLNVRYEAMYTVCHATHQLTSDSVFNFFNSACQHIFASGNSILLAQDTKPDLKMDIVETYLKFF